MARDQHRHELVADLLAAHRAAVLVARLHEQREHVGALLERGILLGDRDQFIEHRVDLRTQLPEARPGRPRAEVAPEPGREHQTRSEHRPPRQHLFERLLAGALGAEDRTQDRAQRDPLHRSRDTQLDVARASSRSPRRRPPRSSTRRRACAGP